MKLYPIPGEHGKLKEIKIVCESTHEEQTLRAMLVDKKATIWRKGDGEYFISEKEEEDEQR